MSNRSEALPSPVSSSNEEVATDKLKAIGCPIDCSCLSTFRFSPPEAGNLFEPDLAPLTFEVIAEHFIREASRFRNPDRDAPLSTENADWLTRVARSCSDDLRIARQSVGDDHALESIEQALAKLALIGAYVNELRRPPSSPGKSHAPPVAAGLEIVHALMFPGLDPNSFFAVHRAPALTAYERAEACQVAAGFLERLWPREALRSEFGEPSTKAISKRLRLALKGSRTRFVDRVLGGSQMIFPGRD